MYTERLMHFDFQMYEEFHEINQNTDIKLRVAWHQYRDGILERACNKPAVNTALKTTTDAVTTDAVMDQYNEGLDFLHHNVI
jgi:hypothetical protein